MQSQRRASIEVLPPVHRCKVGDAVVDKSLFKKSVSVLAAQVPSSQTGALLKSDTLRGFVMNLPKVRTVIPCSTNDLHRLLLLRVTQENELSGEAREFLKKTGASLVHHKLHFDYDYWTADEILGAVLPEELCDESPTGFAMTGHIAHLNLRDEYLPYKRIIGQVILDKNTRVKTVVNKVDTITNQFRVFDMELIAGDPEYVVEHHESDCRFIFDFREVYWNSRLHTEHDRLVQMFRPEDGGVIVDVFAGVGPFAVPAGKKGCAVLANDLNPNSFKWLKKNITDNNTSENIRAYCEDGREFIRKSFLRAYDEPFSAYSGPRPSKRKLKELQRQGREANLSQATETEKRNRISHFVMNLPDSAIEFLDAFRGALSQGLQEIRTLYDEMPMVHCHCFTRFLEPDEAERDIRNRVMNALGKPIEKDVQLHLVRSVAPNKEMYCISFRLPKSVVYSD